LQITTCPPVAETRVHFDKHQFDNRLNAPVDAHYVGTGNGINGWVSTGIDFGSYALMHTFHSKGGRGDRRLTTPLWAQSDDATRRVILAFMESRAFSKKKRATLRGDERERFLQVMAALRVRVTFLTETCERLCHEYVECADDARHKVLQTQISNVDRQLQLAGRPDVFHGVVTDYYRLRLNSVECAEKYGMSPWGIRQFLYRINLCARSLGYTVDATDPEAVEQRRLQKEATREQYRERKRLEVRAAREARKAARDAAREARLTAPKPPRVWRATGRCTYCGGERRPGGLSCADCHDRNQKASRLWRARNSAL
jgi:hypothetical protein